MRLRTSPIPIRQTLRLWSSVISLHPARTSDVFDSEILAAMAVARVANCTRSSLFSFLYLPLVNIWWYCSASWCEGPTSPFCQTGGFVNHILIYFMEIFSPMLLSDIKFMAALIFPWSTRFANNFILLFFNTRRQSFLHSAIYRSSHPEVFLGKGVLKIYRAFTGEHPYRSAISIKLLSR